MPSSVRPKNASSSTRPAPATPMSERQQMALLMQMTSQASDAGSRSPGGTASRSRDRNERGETPLHLAAIKGDVEQVSKLLGHHADPNAADFAGWTPLHEASNHGWYEVASKLIQAGANVNVKGLDNDTPLHDAAANGNVKLARLLVENGADIHAKNSKGKSPLDVAAAGIAPILLNPNEPVAESSVATRLQPPRTRDEKKMTETTKQKTSSTTTNNTEETMDTAKPVEDVYEFKATKETEVTAEKSAPDAVETDANDVEGNAATAPPGGDEGAKRPFTEVADSNEDAEDESKRKKRKEETKEAKSAAPASSRASAPGKGQSSKQGTSTQSKGVATLSAAGAKGVAERKSPCPSPKPVAASDAEGEDGKADLRVPPLKIVIPQSMAAEAESGSAKNGKNNSQRAHQALPYVVPISNSETGDKDAVAGGGTTSPTDAAGVKTTEEKKEPSPASEEQRSGHNQRVLRSSHRTGTAQGNVDRSSNNSSPQLQRSHSPSPSASPSAPTNQSETSTPSNATVTASKCSDSQSSAANETESSLSSTTSSTTTTSTVELHPRKRKLKPSKEPSVPPLAHDSPEQPTVSEIHPHEQPTTNCYQLYLDIRKQIERRRKGLVPVQPKPPQGFKDYLMNRCTYVLAGTTPNAPNITYPSCLQPQMKDLFTDQEKERYRLRMQHVIEKEKLVLSVEQEILRVHGRAARALANQSLPFSVCTILRDEEVYNLITPEQEEKDRNARSRYNGRLFLSWLQDVDDKWEKIKEHMLLRHHNEAESLHAVQKMDWEWKLKELNLCDEKVTPVIDDLHVPMVIVTDDFDLLPA